MLFRYKITSCGYDSFDRFNHGYAIRYYVEIQYFKSSAKIFKWRKFEDTKLCCVLNQLGFNEDDMYSFEAFKRAVDQHKGIDEIMFKYINQEVQKRNAKKKTNELENEMDKVVLTNGWHAIEIKENE